MRSILFVLNLMLAFSIFAQNRILPESDYLYWPVYKHLKFEELADLEKQEWNPTDHTITNWDFSLPTNLIPSEKSMFGVSRKFKLKDRFSPYKLNFKANITAVIWVKWRDLEPTEGNYNFEPLVAQIKDAKKNNYKVLLRLLSTSRSRGPDNKNLNKGQAPIWLEEYNINFLPKEQESHNLNYDPSHPEFHKRYLKLIAAISKTEIPQLVDAAYIGYASKSNGDEGIGPIHNNGQKNDTIQHVRERIDAFAKAFNGMKSKVFMGGPSEYGFSKGFGVRRGFVEMYLYTIPDSYIGQYLDKDGYLCVDETVPVIANNSFNGEENEEYEEKWASAQRGFRFGTTTNSYPYRYFISSLRLLQMRCNYVLSSGHLFPEMVPFIAQELGRTVEDTPDVWSFLYTGKIRKGNYEKYDTKDRSFSQREILEGIPVKNMERWLYQRDSKDFETTPAIQINHAIKMWMVQPNHHYDYIARKGKNIGFDIDDRWLLKNQSKKYALKISYFDQREGSLDVVYKLNGKTIEKKHKLDGKGAFKTVTILVDGFDNNAIRKKYDFYLSADKKAKEITVSMVRIVAF